MQIKEINKIIVEAFSLIDETDIKGNIVVISKDKVRVRKC